MTKVSTESEIYAKLGASSAKGAVLGALGNKHRSFFAEVGDDVCGDPEYYSLLHADGAGTKSILAYLKFKETNDPSAFRSLAQDSLIMNLDDVACLGAFEALSLSNTIGRNKHTIPDSAIKEIIDGYKNLINDLKKLSININMSGGETADVGDLVRTIIVDSTLFARVKKSEVISTDNIQTGDVIIGLSSTGQASYETTANSGIASNGFTLARHALIPSKLCDKYPEISDPNVSLKNKLNHDIFTFNKKLGSSIIDALLSPTRTYAPIIKKIIDSKIAINAIIHCSGGGQTKLAGFGRNKRYIKDNLFECPEIFKLIQTSLNVPWSEMYAVFNMGHRIEIILPEEYAKDIINISNSFKIDAKIVGRVEESKEQNEVLINSPYGSFSY